MPYVTIFEVKTADRKITERVEVTRFSYKLDDYLGPSWQANRYIKEHIIPKECIKWGSGYWRMSSGNVASNGHYLIECEYRVTWNVEFTSRWFEVCEEK